MANFSEQHLKVQKVMNADGSLAIPQEREWLVSVFSRADEIAAVQDTACMIQEMLDLMIDTCAADTATYFQLDKTTDELVVTHVRGDAESQYLVGLRLNRQQGLPGISFCDSKIIVIGDLLSEPDWLNTVDPMNASKKKNVISLPVYTKENTLGVIQIFNYQKAEVDLLKLLSSRLAKELESRLDQENIQRSNRRLLTLLDMLGDVAGTLDRNHLLHLVTENAARLVDAERSSIFLVDPSTSEMVFQVAYQPQTAGKPATVDEFSEKRSRFPKPNHQVRINTPRKTSPENAQEDEFSYFNRSAITVPLRSDPFEQAQTAEGKRLLGGLMVLNQPNSTFQAEDAQLMRILANQASTFLQVAEIYESTEELFLGVIKSLITAIDAKDPYTQGHSQRVSDYSVLIAQELGYDETLLNDIRIGSLLHDIGKIGMPDSILMKKGTLSASEIEVMRQHPRTGVNILSQVKLLHPMKPAILEHHERLDGSGYPSHLTDKQISWMGRIVAVADVFDAMTSDRPYRRALSIDAVLTYLHENENTLFDEQCVRALDNIISRAV